MALKVLNKSKDEQNKHGQHNLESTDENQSVWQARIYSMKISFTSFKMASGGFQSFFFFFLLFLNPSLTIPYHGIGNTFL